MAKKAELLEKAKSLRLEVSSKNTIAEIEAAIQNAAHSSTKEPDAAPRKSETAKAGKRSEKAQRESEESAEKEARKSSGDTSPHNEDSKSLVKKGPKPSTRPKAERRGKKYQATAKLVEPQRVYSLTEALELAVKTSPVNFDASVEVHVRLGVDPRQADQNVRATVTLPNGTGKTLRVAVFAPESEQAAAKKAGADIAGDEEFITQLEREELNFDVLVATPAFMPRLGKYARVLGPRGLMPNPKSGTVASNVAKAVREAKAGKVEYRVDKQAIVHLSIGKVSFGAAKLAENAKAFFDSLQSQKPGSLKGSYVKTTSVSTTMGPGIKVENVVS